MLNLEFGFTLADRDPSNGQAVVLNDVSFIGLPYPTKSLALFLGIPTAGD